MKIRTINDLQDQLDKEFSWRFRELVALKRQIDRLKGQARDSLIRANIAMLYAHWEGFVKAAALYYIEYVSRRQLRVSELASCFAFLALRKHLNEVSSTNAASSGLQALNFIREAEDQTHALSFDGSIRTESNLSSQVLLNILRTLGIPTAKYETYEQLIDSELLKRRNKVAHGEFVELDDRGYSELSNEVMNLMRWIKTDIENAATNEDFRKTA